MIERTSILDHILSKKLDGQQTQQRPWQRVINKNNNKKQPNSKFTALLDKHFATPTISNYFSPLSFSNEQIPSTSTSFPAIMPTQRTIITPSNQKQPSKHQPRIDTMFNKKDHTRKGRTPGKSSGSEGGSVTSPRRDSIKPSNTKPTTPPATKIVRAPIPGIDLTGNERYENSESDKEYDAITKAGPSSRNRREPMIIPTPNSSVGRNSDNEDDSDFGKDEWEIPGKADNAKDQWDSDSDSDALVSKIIDKVSAKVYSGKGSKNNRIVRDDGRRSRNIGRGGGGRGDREWGRGRGKGRGGGCGSDRDSDFDHDNIPTHSNKVQVQDEAADPEYTDEEAAVAVAVGAKRRKGITNHRTKRDTVMDDGATSSNFAQPPHVGQGNDGEHMEADDDGVGENENEDEDVGAETSADVNAGHENEDLGADASEDDDAVYENADSDNMATNGLSDQDNTEADNDDDNVDDDDAEEASVHTQTDAQDIDVAGNQDDIPVPLYDSKWLFEFLPKEKVDRFKIDEIVGCLATAVRSVDSTAYIASWDNTSQTRIWSNETVPKTDAEMEHFVEDPHTSSVGTFGRLYGRLRLISSMKLADIKVNPEFGAWIRAQGLFLDASEIPTTRPKLIGFFDRKLPHTSRIDLFKGFLKKSVRLSRPFQILSQTINAGDQTDLKCYVYVLKADSQDADILVKELASFIRPTSAVRFYPWEDFRDHTELADKRKIISDMTTYARNHASFVFHGIVANDYMRLTLDKNKRTPDEVSGKNMSSLQAAYLSEETEKDTAYSNTRCLEYMQQVFADSDGEPIFKRIDGPYQGKIEVTFAKCYFNKVRDIEKRFISIIASKMTELSKSTCFSPWPAPLTPASMTNFWTPPKAFKRTGTVLGSNPYRKSGGMIEYSLTSNSNMSYKDASTLGRRQIDIPTTLVVQSNKASSATTPATISDTTLTSAKDSAFLAEMKAAQTAFQTQYDERLAKLDDTIARIAADSEATSKTLANLTIEVNAKHIEFQKSQRLSEERITKALKLQTKLHKRDAAANQRMMVKIWKKLGGEDTDYQDSENDEDDDRDDDHDDDTIMKQAEPKGSSRTNHPKDKNKKIIHQRHRTTERVAARVK